MGKKICNGLMTLILIVLGLLAGLLLGPRVIGYQTLSVLSGSMEPEIPVGSIVYTKAIEPEELKVRDVITYRINGTTLVTHRIVEADAEKEQFITKGDANDVNDGSPVSYEQVVGKVRFHVPYLGYASIYMRTPLGIGVVCGVVVVMIILNMLSEVFEKKKDIPSELNNDSAKDSE